ncbi:YceI family protein [Olivibacter sitiensis]|uniref:YceI family protein n=1 Tax=Olivibacter sitiensis TaxID=376470 RepID=UPI000427AA30|nr:YceI family protein [Olivibacter sitiensis]
MKRKLLKEIIVTLSVLGFLSAFTSCDKDKNQTYQIQSGSTATWTGFLETGYFNTGTIALQNDAITVSGSRITGGTITMPLSSLVNSNLETQEAKAQLIEHLQSAAFFNAALYPNVKYTIKSAEPLAENDQDGNNYLIKGDLSILGQVRALQMPAVLHITPTEISAKAYFTFDRTLWGMNYATDSQLPPEDKIKNEIAVAFDLKATINQ